MSLFKFRTTALAAALMAISAVAVSPAVLAQSKEVNLEQEVRPMAASPEKMQALRDQIAKRVPAAAQLSLGENKAKIDPLVLELMVSQMATSADGRLPVKVKLRDKKSAALMMQAKSGDGYGQMQGEPNADNVVKMRVSAAELAKLADSASVTSVNMVWDQAATTRVGSKLTEGDGLLSAKAARDQFNVDGSGKSVCVISDGVTAIDTAKASGDLPASVEVCTQSPGSGNEGIAMLEIVHDLAPGAKLAFCSGLERGENDFLAAIKWSATQANGGKGCDVIVDDLGFFLEPRFQISDESEYINTVLKQKGITYVSSAGNGAQNSYLSYFRNADFSGRTPNAGFHDFGRAAGKPSEIGFPILVAPKGRSAVFLQWSEPFGTATSDFVMKAVLAGGKDIRAADSPFTVLLETDLVQNGVNSIPVEVVAVTNNSDELQVYFVTVQRKTGTSFVEISMLNNDNSDTSRFATNFRTTDGSIFGHSGAANTISVAAVAASEPGLATIEEFSSRGLVRTTFDNAGNRRSALAFKPDVTATDGVSVTGAGGFPKTFFGTSASAPHVAAIAALVKNVNANANVASVLKFSADDRGNPGPDTTWGFGLVNAQRALERAPLFGGLN